MTTPDTNSAPPSLSPAMDHEEAVRQMAVEGYLLNELTPAVREAFEQHFFDCQECAAELRATSIFLDTAKKQLGTTAHRFAAKPEPKFWVTWLFRPAFIAPLFACMLLLIVYQTLQRPGMSRESPEVLTTASLVGGNSRGGAADFPVRVSSGKPILLSVDVPTQDQFTGYELALISPAGATLWRLPISAEQAVDTVSIRVPTAHWLPGEYRLIVYGQSHSAAEPAELAHYRFSFDNQSGYNTRR